ncbi:MAG: PolC-type DNA polymerase III [Bacilli bacterium]|nr:PolC-type DNA polymerase III [Bacilli bacterium]
MHDKVKILLDKIKLEEQYYSFFNDSKLKKLYINEDSKKWSFLIEIENTLPTDVYNEINRLLKEYYKDLSEVSITYIPTNINYKLLKEYYINTIDEIGKKILQIFKDNIITYENNIINIEVYNKVEKEKLNKYLPDFKKHFIRAGFDFDINVFINEEKRETVKNEIFKETFIKADPKNSKENPLIIGVEIKDKKTTTIKEIISELTTVTIDAYIFKVEYFESSKKDFKILTLKVSDNTDSISVKLFTRDVSEYQMLCKRLTPNKWYKIKGYVKNDPYAKDLVINARDIMDIESKDDEIIDDAPLKRVELHTHTQMSQMDGLVNVLDLTKRAAKWGHKAIAITDHNCCQAFTDAYHKAKGVNIIYGVEISMIDDNIDIVIRPNKETLIDATYVVFDFETTGFNATSGDSIIEVGAVKMKNGEILETFSELINPGRDISPKITEVTNITNKMLKGKDTEENVIKRFKEWCKDLPMVAHNAKFDVSFLESAFHKYNLGTFTNPVIDTLELSRTIDSNQFRHGLTYVTKRYNVEFAEDAHHRADYDAKATALVLHQMILKLINRNIEKISDLKDIVNKEDICKIGRPYHITLLAKNQIGLKNMFRIVSYANTKYFYKTPRILRSEIEANREGLLIGSGCADGEIFTLARSKSDEEMNTLMQWYDYIEVQPISVMNHLIQLNDFGNIQELKDHVEKIIKIGKDNNKLVVATGDVHHLDKKDKVFREIIINQKVPGGGRHPLNRTEITNIPSKHFMTTNEMLEEFSFLDKDLAFEIVVTNSNLVADMIEKIIVIKDSPKPLSPKMDNSDQIVKDLTYSRAHELYGDILPEIVEDRVTKELNGIIGGGFDVIYLIAQKLVKKSNDDGYLVGSRGSVGSSFVAHMMGITEVNALPAHYLCPKCKKSIFEEEGMSLGSMYASGYDLPNKKCSCGTMMKKEGQDMPFATFLGFNADKVPDIDLNFSGEYQAKAHDYTKELFGENFVFRAGTISTVADKTAYGYVKGYMEEKGKMIRPVEVERLALGCTDVKRTTGQHPGGIIVIPNYMDVLDFTPYQYPADDTSSRWFTTHFDYHSMELDLLKLDILGHDDPTILKMLQDLSGINILDIPLDDEGVLELFSSTKSLGITKEDIMCEVGTYGVPEFGTKFVQEMLLETRPKTFAELVKISGLSHGTDVWRGNAQELILNKTCEFKEVIGCRDDIMVYLSYHGLDPKDAFKIMEFVRKGKPSKEPDEWHNTWVPKMIEKNIPAWYIESCFRIKYMFPKAHAVAYVMMGCRVAWFKVHQPINYYCAYLSIRCHDFDIDTMIKGYDAIKEKIIELNNKGYDKTNKEDAILDVLYTSLELTARGFKIGKFDLYKSDATNFIIDEDKLTLIPPFRTIDGLGDVVAKKIIEERAIKPFISIEDLQKRGKASQTIIDKMRVMGLLKDLPESSQLTLF